jgi:hypothetical protein
MNSISWSSVALACLIGVTGCVSMAEGTADDDDEHGDLADRHPSDEHLADEFDDGLVSSLLEEDAIPALPQIADPFSPTTEAPEDLEAARAAESASTTPRCTATAKFGDYCGGNKVVGGARHRLYRCTGPNTVAKVLSVCGYGCTIAPAGTDDHCAAKPPPTCDGDARTGDYCGGDKVSYASPNTLYHCAGPGRATAVRVCSAGCRVAAAGSDDYCKAPAPSGAVEACPHAAATLRWGLHPIASDRLRCAGVSAARITQTIGSAAASAGTHAQDGVYNGHAYSAATDLSVKGLSDAQVRTLVARLDRLGFAAFFRNPGYNGWPSSEARHLHVVFGGARMKSSLRSQIWDFLAGKNGLTSHLTMTFYQPPAEVKDYLKRIFLAAN